MLGGQLKGVFGNGAIAWDREECDVLDYRNLARKIKGLGGSLSAVINCAAYNNVDGAETDRQTAFKLNAEFVGELAAICKENGISLVHFSSNYVFDGRLGEYSESDRPNPESVYAQSKFQGEQELQKNGGNFYLVRTAVLFGPKGESPKAKPSFVDLMLDLSKKADTIKAVSDEINSITYARDLAAAVKTLLEEKYPYGIYHLVNSGCASWYELAGEIFRIAGKTANLVPIHSSEYPRPARRPQKSVLLNTKFPPLRPWREALREYMQRN